MVTGLNNILGTVHDLSSALKTITHYLLVLLNWDAPFCLLMVARKHCPYRKLHIWWGIKNTFTALRNYLFFSIIYFLELIFCEMGREIMSVISCVFTSLWKVETIAYQYFVFQMYFKWVLIKPCAILVASGTHTSVHSHMFFVVSVCFYLTILKKTTFLLCVLNKVTSELQFLKRTAAWTDTHPSSGCCSLSFMSSHSLFLSLRVRSAFYVGLLCVLGTRILRLKERASRSTALPTVPPNSFLEVRPSMFPLYHMTQPAKDSSTRRAPEYTNRSPKSRPWISRGAKTPSSRDMTPSRSISTANTRASLQWDRPSYLVAIAAHESIKDHVKVFE